MTRERRVPVRTLVWTLVGAGAIVLSVAGVADEAGRAHASEALTRALVTFAVARSLNGVISVAQGTAVAVEPAGVGVNLTVGQVLDPVNDLVEQFSGVMLVAAASLGLQNILLRISTWWGMSAVLIVAVAFAWIALWGRVSPRTKTVALRMLIAALLVRFAVPALIICTSLVFDTFLAADQAEATRVLELTRGEIAELNEEQALPPVIEDRSLLERLGSMVDSTMSAMNVGDRLDELQARVSDAIEEIVNLIVIFVLETILLPLAFLWLFVTLAKAAAGRVGKR